MISARDAFSRISSLYFPSHYNPGFVDATGGGTNTYERKETARRLIDDFWDSNTNTDYEATYIKDDCNASSGGFSAFTAFYPYKGQRTLNTQFTIRTKDTDGTHKPPEIIEAAFMHELLHLRQIMGNIRPYIESGLKPKDITPEGADILFATLSNSASPIVLSPRARMLVISRFMEADTGAKTPWLAANKAQENPNFLDILTTDSLSVRKFLEIQNQAPDLQSAIREAAWVSMNTPNWGNKGSPQENWTFGDYYQWEVLNTYDYGFNEQSDRNEWNSLRLNTGEPIEFVDIDLNDPRDRQSLLKIGESFGPNPFEYNGDLHPMFCGEIQLKPEIEAKVQEIEKLLGIHGKKLQTYNQALDTWGMNPFNYMARSTGITEDRPFPFSKNVVIAQPPPGSPKMTQSQEQHSTFELSSPS
ncbi:MAG: hypothetical protein WBK77_08775 [Alphaproteobacteria bacterium]